MSDHPATGESHESAGQESGRGAREAFRVISKTIQGESSLGESPRLGAEEVSAQLDSARRHPLLTGVVTLAITAAVGFAVATIYARMRQARQN